ERIVVVSDLHGAKPEVVARLNSLVENPPRAVILAGDVAGNQDLEDLQRLYYNFLTNHTRNELFAGKDDVEREVKRQSLSDSEILSYTGIKPPEDGFTVKNGFLKLKRKELELEGLSSEEIDREINEMDDHQVAETIRDYSKYVHYGHYASNLSSEAKSTLANGIRENAEKIADVLKQLQKAGSFVAINEGNWDPSPPIAFEPGVPTANRLKSSDQPFSTQEFFKSEGIPYFTGMGVVETERAMFVLLPFDQLVRFSNMSQEEVEKYADHISARVKNAKGKGKQIIVVQHAEAAWRPHNLTNPDSTPGGEHRQILDGLAKVVRYIKPDEILHGHFHDPFVDESGVKQPVDTKYALEIFSDDAPRVIEDREDFKSGQAVVSFMPFQTMAEITIKEDDHGVKGFGGTREPAEVK
ncbi:MAG: metallophosphoesterase, partial [Candidatus Levyibacteriota bacterium]